MENYRHISTESPKEGFNDTVFQHFVDGQIKALVPVFLCLCLIHVVVMLPFSE